MVDKKARKPTIETVFLDIGGVVLSNGWQQDGREEAAEKFGFDFEDFNQRHKLIFETFEIGKVTLDEYLDFTLFDKRRKFTKRQISEFMFEQSTQSPEMFVFFNQLRKLKEDHGVKVIAVNNEARELNEYRIETYALDSLIDFFVSSCYIHVRKPSSDIFKFAIQFSQTEPSRIAYIDDQPMFGVVASKFGIHSIHHTDGPTTIKTLASLGLK